MRCDLLSGKDEMAFGRDRYISIPGIFRTIDYRIFFTPPFPKILLLATKLYLQKYY